MKIKKNKTIISQIFSIGQKKMHHSPEQQCKPIFNKMNIGGHQTVSLRYFTPLS